MKLFKIAIIGSGSNCTRVCDFLKPYPNFNIVGIIQTAHIDTATDLLNNFHITTGLDIIIDTTENIQMLKGLYEYKPPGVQIMEVKGIELLFSMADTLKVHTYNTTDNALNHDLEYLVQELQRSTAIIKEIQKKVTVRSEKTQSAYPEQLMSIDDMEQILLKQALNKYGSTVEGKKEAAKALNISLATLYNKLKKYRIG